LNEFKHLKLQDSDSFETASQKLEQIVKLLEEGDLTLDNALELYEEGIRLYRFCNQKLNHAEQKISIVLDDDESSQRIFSLEDLEGEDANEFGN